MTTAPDLLDRITVEDLMSLAADRGSVPMQVGATLTFASGEPLEAAAVAALLAERVSRVPRLRRRLVRPPFGGGRPVWVDDTDFSIDRHFSVTRVTALDDSLMTIAAERLVRPLPFDRPLWSATFVEDGHGDAALVVVFHHVLAGGTAALAVLANLADGSPAVPDPGFPRPAPPLARLVRDAAGERVRSLRKVPARLRRLVLASRLLESGLGRRAQDCSLNEPTGPRREVLSVTTGLASVASAGRANGATVNDVVLTAIGGAVSELLAARGEAISELVVSVPFAVPAGDALGNHSAVLPVRVPNLADPMERLRAVASATREAKRSERGASNVLLGPAFRLLAGTRLFRRFIDRQRMIHTFVTNLRGPADRLAFGGHVIQSIVPLGAITGNVTVAFAILSYAGGLTVAVMADPDRTPDSGRLRTLLEENLSTVTGATRAGPVAAPLGSDGH